MIFYLSGAGLYGAFLLFNLLGDRECPNSDATSWIAIVIASSLWVVTVPLSLLELSSKAKKRSSVATEAIDSTMVDRTTDEPISTTGAFS